MDGDEADADARESSWGRCTAGQVDGELGAWGLKSNEVSRNRR